MKELKHIEFAQDKEEAIVFLHGYPDGPEVFIDHAKKLSKDFQILLPELPSYAHSVDEIVLKLGLLIRQKIKNKRIHLIGHDIGGFYLSELIYKGLITSNESSLILINTLPRKIMRARFFKPEQLVRSWYAFVFQSQLLSILTIKRLRSYWEKVFTEQGSSIDSTTEQRMLRDAFHYRILLKKCALDGSELNQIQCQTTLIWSSQDPFLVAPTQKELNKAFAKWRLVPLKSGHWPFRDLKNDITSCVQEHIEMLKEKNKCRAGQLI